MPALGPVTVITPLAADALVFASMYGHEALGEPFDYQVDLVSEDPTIAWTDLLGQTIAVKVQLPQGGERYFHGHVTSFEFVEGGGTAAIYRAAIRPWLWLLTQTTNCRIFQNKSIPDIVKQVFRDHDFADFEERLGEDYAPKDYIVQYRESDFNFVSRLLEESGIYYYFRHSATAHTLVLADSPSAHEAVSGYAELAYYPPDEHRASLEEFVDLWRLKQTITPGAAALRDFDFERPRANLTASVSSAGDYTHGDFALYDYPGDYRERGDGEKLARLRLEQRQVGFARAEGHTNARGLSAGALFSLTDHTRDDLNREYLVSYAQVSVEGHPLQTGGWSGGGVFSCELSAMPSDVPFRSAPKARRPVMDGPQTATVVGAAGEEIWTDRYGRIKIQFHWDREGRSDQDSSCWVRVAQLWAGSGWGGIHIPRIGQEVVVDFLEGDPDRPIVVGRVYNASNMPPYGLPGNQTQSGVMSRSTKGGNAANANEIRFEDRKGSEQFFIQAEKDLEALVKNDESVTVGANRSESIGADDALSVGHNRTVKVQANETITIAGDETVSILGNQALSVGANDTMTVAGSQSLSVTGSQSVTVTGSQSLTVSGSRSEQVLGAETIVVVAGQALTAASQAVTVGSRVTTVAAGDTLTVGGDLGETVGGALGVSVAGARSESVGGNASVTIGGDHTVSITGAGSIKVGKSFVVDVGDEVTIKAGDASVTLKKSGDVLVKGSKVTVQASSDIVLKGSKVSIN
jgi:type VI secretion system secreted protein VgrG